MSVAVAEVHELTNVSEISPQQQLIENLKESYAYLFKRADELHASLANVPEVIADEETAKLAADAAKQIGYGVKDLNDTRAKEKAPHDANSATVQNTFMTPINLLKKDKSIIEDRLQVYQEAVLERKRKEAEEKARLVREEAERKRKEEEARLAAEKAEADRLAREAREKHEAELRAIEEKKRQAEAEERQARERQAEAERKQREAEEAAAAADRQRKEAEEAAAAAERKRTEELTAAREAQERAEKQRREAAALREKAERDRREAAEAREKAETLRRQQEERGAVRIEQADNKGAKMVEKAEARVINASERETAAIVKETRVLEARPHEFGNIRGDHGATATLRMDWDCQVTDVELLRGPEALATLAPHLDQESLEKALRAFVKAGGRQIPGAVIFEDTNTVVR